MDTLESPLLSVAALSVLDRMPFDPKARGSFELMSGGLLWPDEFPTFESPDWFVVSSNSLHRSLLGARASISLGTERPELLPVWDQVVRHAPHWPGLRPERRGETALRRLQAALQRQDECFVEFESKMKTIGRDV